MSNTLRRRGLLLSAMMLVAGLLAMVAVTPSAAASESAEVELRVADFTGVLAPEEPTHDSAGEAEDETERGLAARMLEEGHHPGGDLEMRLLVHNRGEEPVDGLRAVIEVHAAVDDRDELATALDGDGPAGVPTVHQQDVREAGELGAGEIAGLEEVLTSEQIPWAQEGGVHPVRISLVRGAEVIDEVTTAVVWLGEAVGEPLLTTMVWPLTDQPWRAEQGAYPRGVHGDIREGGRLDQLLRGLELASDPGVLLAPSAHLLEDLRDQSRGFELLERQEDDTRARREIGPDDHAALRAAHTLERVRGLAGELTHQSVTGAYAHADLAGMVEHGSDLREIAGELATEGRSRLQRGLDQSVDPTAFLLSDPITPEVLDLMPSQHLLVAPEVIADPPTDGRLHQLRSPSGRPLTASVGDATITDALADGDGDPDGLLTAQRVMAETAARFFAEPGVSDRSMALHPPDDWDPHPDAVRALLDGIGTAPWLELVSPAQLTSQAERGTGTLELAPLENEGLPSTFADQLGAAFGDLQAASEAWPADTDERPEPSHRRMHTALLRSTSVLLDSEAEAAGLVDDVESSLDQFFGDIEVAGSSQVTLTADSGQVPVTVQRTNGGPIAARVEVESQGRLVWEERHSDEIVLDDEDAHTVSFETRALGTGTFPVTVVVTDVTGTRELDRATMRVRSTAVSGPALSATGILVLGLLLIGAVRRRPRGPRLHVIDHDLSRPPDA